MLPSGCSQEAVGCLDGSGRTRGCAALLRFLTALFRQEQAVISCPVVFLRSSSLSIQLVFGLERLWDLD